MCPPEKKLSSSRLYLGRTRCCQTCLQTQHQCVLEFLSSGVMIKLDSQLVAAHHVFAKYIET